MAAAALLRCTLQARCAPVCPRRESECQPHSTFQRLGYGVGRNIQNKELVRHLVGEITVVKPETSLQSGTLVIQEENQFLQVVL